MSNGLQQTYIAGRTDADKLGSDINEYTKVLYGVAKVLKNRGFNTTANELSNWFHNPLASIRASEQIEQIIKAMDATFADGLKRGKDSYETTKAIDQSTVSWRQTRLNSAVTHDPTNDVEGLISDHLKDKFTGIRRGTKQWKEESEKVADKALKAARTKKVNSIREELSQFKSWWDRDGQKLIDTAQREADHTETQMKIIYALNPDSKAIQEAEDQLKSINSRIIQFQSSGTSTIQKAEAELKKLSEVQEIKKDIEKGETVTIPANVITENIKKIKSESKYFRNVSKEYDDRSGYYNVHELVEKAYPFTYEGIEMFAAKGMGLHPIWNVTEVKTGLLIPGDGKTKDVAIQAAKKTVDRSTPAKIKEMITTSAKRMEKEGFKEYVEESEVKDIKKNLQKNETITVPSSFLKAIKPVINKEIKKPNYGTYNKGGRTQTGIVSYDYYEVEPNPPKDLQYQGIKSFHGDSASLMFSKSTGKTYINPANTKEYLTHVRHEKSEGDWDDETARFGEKVTVTADPDNPEIYHAYKGTIIRSLNKGKLIEVRPEGQTEGSFRVDASRVIPAQEIAEIKKEVGKGETVEVPEHVISEITTDKQFIGKRAKHSEFGEVLVIWENPAKNRALIQFDDGEKQETQMHKLKFLSSLEKEKEVPATIKEEIKQGETVTIPADSIKPVAEKQTFRYASFNRPLWIGFDPGVPYKIVEKTMADNINGRAPHDVIETNIPISEEHKYSLQLTDYQEVADKNELMDYARTKMEGSYLGNMIDQIRNKKVTTKEKIDYYVGKIPNRLAASRASPDIGDIKQELAKGETVTVPVEVIESTPETDWNYSLKKALKHEEDERKRIYTTVEAFREARTKQADLLESDFHLKSYKDKAEKYKPGTIQYNKHMAVYKERLKEIADLRKEAEAGKTLQELKLEETMRQNDEQVAEKRSQEDIELKRDERLRNTDTEILKQSAFAANIAWTNDKLSWKDRRAAKDEGRAVLAILTERGIDISQELIAHKLSSSEVKEIKKEMDKGKTVTIPESTLKATVEIISNDLERSKYTYPLSSEEIKENELSGGIEVHNIGGLSKRNSKGQIIGSNDLGFIRLKNGKYYTEYQGKEGWVKGLAFDNYIHAHRYVLDKSGYKPIPDIKEEVTKGETVTVPEEALKMVVDAEPSAEVKEWFDKAHGIKDYKGGRQDRRNILSMLINNMPYGNVKSFGDMAKMAKAIGKDMGYGEATSGTWERHFAEQIANETGRDVSIIGNAIVVHPGNKHSEKLPDGGLKPIPMPEPAPKKPAEEPQDVKEKIDTGNAILDELIEASDKVYPMAVYNVESKYYKRQEEARKYTQDIYNFLLHGGEEPDIPVMLKPHSTDSTDEYIKLEAKLKLLFKKAVAAAKKTRSLQKKQVDTVKSQVSEGETVVVPEPVLKTATQPVSDAENQRRIDLMNEKIKTKRTLNVGVFHEGKLIRGGFKDAYSASNFMNDTFFVGTRASAEKRRALNPADFGWKVELIDEKIEILNKDELKQIASGKTVEVSEAVIIEDIESTQKQKVIKYSDPITGKEVKNTFDLVHAEDLPNYSSFRNQLPYFLNPKGFNYTKMVDDFVDDFNKKHHTARFVTTRYIVEKAISNARKAPPSPLIEDVREIKKDMARGETVTVSEPALKVQMQDTRTDAQIIEDLSKEEKTSSRRPYSELTLREKTIVDKEAIKQYPVTSAHIGALITISGTDDKRLKEFDNLLRQGETIAIPQPLLAKQLEAPAAPALLYPSSPGYGDRNFIKEGKTLKISGAKLGAMLQPAKKINKPKPKPESKHLCTPPVRVRGYHVVEHNRSCPVKGKGKRK